MKAVLHLLLIITTFWLSASCGAPEETTEATRAEEYDDYSPAWSPDGSKIVFGSTRTGNRDLFLMNADGSDEAQLTFHEGIDWTPAWSPDGTKIVFCSDRDGSQDVYVMNPDGSDPVRLTDHPATDCSPSWSPDGERILFMSTRDGDWEDDPEDNWEIYVMNAVGTGQTRLTQTPGYDLITGQAWSPDGTRIVFCSNMDEKYDDNDPDKFDGFDLYVMDADGSNLARLTSTEGQESYAFWSPDGARISYTGVEKEAPIEASGGENYEIYTIDPDGTDIRQLTDDPGYDFEGWWSPDSRKIVYASSEVPPMAIYVMDADGSGKTRLTNKD
jgi:TolB protein